MGDNIQNIVYNYTGTVSSFHLPNGIIASSTTVAGVSSLTLSGTPTEDGYFNYTITTVNICGTENVFGEITIIPAIIGNTSGIDLVVNCNGSAFTLIGGSINLNSIVDYDYLWEYSTSITGPFVPAPGNKITPEITSATRFDVLRRALQLICSQLRLLHRDRGAHCAKPIDTFLVLDALTA